jgi:hypothetical protein
MKIIARHSTPSFDIAITQETPKSGYQVVQIASRVRGYESTYITVSRTLSLDVAKASANRLWLRGMGRETMIGCGPLAV